MITLSLFKISLLIYAYSQSVPLATQLNDVLIGAVNICNGGSLLGLGLGGCGSFTSILVGTTTQTIPVSFAMPQIPNVIVFPMLLQNSGATQMTYKCTVVPGSITLTGFIASVQKFGTTYLDNVQLSYIATFNQNINFQQIAIAGFSNNYQQSFIFSKVYTQLPQVYGFITWFQYAKLVSYDFEQVTNTNFVLKLGTIDLSGTLGAVAIIIDTRVVPLTKSYVGIYQQLIKINAPIASQVVKINNANFCPNWSSNQAIFGFTQLDQSSKAAAFGAQLTNLFDQVNCVWSLTISAVNQLSLSLQFVSISLLTCQDPLQTFMNMLCYCPSNYYDQLNKCVACQLTCFTCSSGTKNDCLSCNPLSFRQLQLTACPCSNGYYDDNVSLICKVCYYSCLTCNLGAKNNCLSCDPLAQRKLQISTCLCSLGYYDDNINPSCKVCYFSCLTCSSGASNACLQCDPLANRKLQLTLTCQCINGYYDDNVQPLCQQCKYFCLTCTGVSNNCQTCDSLSQRQLKASSCACLNGYYDDNLNSLCKLCNYTCLTCYQGANNNCQSCDPLQQRYQKSSTCFCSMGYYDDNVSPQCRVCTYSCLTCTGNQDNCQSCDPLSHRTLNSSTCSCQIGYFDDNINSLCQLCNHTCLTCNQGPNINDCQSCDPLTHRSIQSSTCLCQKGYFDDNINPTCLLCNYTCLTCIARANNCQSCEALSYRLLIIPNCLCQSGYYDDKVNTYCLKCSSKCLTCDGANDINCLSCFKNQYRVIMLQTCMCQPGYTEQGTDTCIKIKCIYSCDTCFGPNIDNCISCSANSLDQRQFSNSACNCQYGYFDNGILRCSACDLSCKTCNGGSGNQCLSCYNTAEFLDNVCRPFLAPKCSKKQFLKNNQCIDCHPFCLSCQGPTLYDCVECVSKLYINLEIQSQPPLFYKYDIDIQRTLSLYNCVNNKMMDYNHLDSQYEGQWIVRNKQNRIILKSQMASQINHQQQNSTLRAGGDSFNIPPFTLDSSEAPHRVYMNLYSGLKIVASANISLNIQSLGKNIQLSPSSTRWGYKQQNQIKVLIYDLEYSDSPLTDISQYRVNWTCQMNDNKTCTNMFQQPLNLNNSLDRQSFGKSTLQPYQSYFFKVSVLDLVGLQVNQQFNTSQVFEQQSVIQIFEQNIPPLVLKFNADYLIKRVNLQEEIIIEFSYDSNLNSDDLYYSANLYYNFNTVATIQYNYHKVKLVIWDYFKDFNSISGLQLFFIGSVFNPAYLMPSYAQITFNINQPPQGCYIATNIQSPYQLIQKIQISILNCTDSDQPIFYKFYYLTKKDAQWNILSQTSDSIALNDYSNQNFIETYVLQAQYVYIMASAQDSYGGITNITSKIMVRNIRRSVLVKNVSIILNETQDYILLRYILILSKSNFLKKEKLLNKMVLAKLENLYQKQNQSLFWYQQLSQAQVFIYASLDSTQKKVSTQNLAIVSSFVDERIFQLRSTWQSLAIRKNYEGQMIQIQSATTQWMIQSDIYTSLISELLSFEPIMNSMNQKYMSHLNHIGDIKVVSLLPNEKVRHFRSQNIETQSTQMTQMMANNYFNPDVGLYVEEINHNRMLINKTKAIQTNLFSIKMIYTIQNPYSSNKSWAYTGYNYTTRNYNVSEGHGQMINIDDLKKKSHVEPQALINYQINSSNVSEYGQAQSIQTCISQNYTTKQWSKSLCALVLLKSQYICQCKTLSVVTIVDDFENVLANNDQIFNPQSLVDVQHFQWYRVSIFYILVVVTALFSIFITWGILKDLRDKLSITTTVHPFNTALPLVVLRQESIIQQSKEVDFFPRGLKSRKTSKNFRSINQKESIVIQADYPFQKLESNRNSDTPNGDDTGRINSQTSLKFNPSSTKSIIMKRDQVEKQKLTFIVFLIINHKLLGIFKTYDPKQSRALRFSLLYFSFLQTLSFVLYFGVTFDIMRAIMVVTMTTIFTVIMGLIINFGLQSAYLLVKMIGALIYVGLSLIMIYIILAIISTTESVEQSNIWAIQFLISFVFQEVAYVLIIIVLKYKITPLILDQIERYKCLRMVLFTAHEITQLQGYIK